VVCSVVLYVVRAVCGILYCAVGIFLQTAITGTESVQYSTFCTCTYIHALLCKQLKNKGTALAVGREGGNVIEGRPSGIIYYKL
jgi:hypothetical protein